MTAGKPNILLLWGDDIGWQQIESFKQFPPRQAPASFNLDRVLEQLRDAAGEGLH